jgi:predicted polyphosphate/ATP-dependent NAD kinase
VSQFGPQSPQTVPTLTEVVDWPDPAQAPAGTSPQPTGGFDESMVMSPATAAPVASVLSEEQLSQRVLADLQHQIDLMIEVRLREVLAPLLQRTADSLVRDARGELASTLREIVARAVAQEMARHRGR